jgi:propionyl-CoA synthetase
VVAALGFVADCVVIGIADEIKGQIPVAFVVLKAGVESTEELLEKALIKSVRIEVGPVAGFKRATFVKRLPKTRSGKILRATMRGIADGKSYTQPSTIEDPAVLDELKLVMSLGQIGIAFSDKS